MSVRYQTEGFLIKKRDQGEADQLLTIYTREFGKVIVLGKGIRKIHSKLKYGADLFNLSDIEFIQGRKIKTLTDIRTLGSFRQTKMSLERVGTLSRMCFSLDLLTPEEEKDERIWDLLKEAFEGLNKGGFPFLIFQYFLWNLFKFSGYEPSLYQCACCQKKLSPDKLYFNCQEGGVVCEKCVQKGGEAVDQETIKILRLFGKKDLKSLAKINLLEKHQSSLNKVLREYFSYFKRVNNLLY